MASRKSDNHAHDLLPSQGGNCLGCEESIGPIPGATSKHDERILALIRDCLTVSAIKYLRDETGCSLGVAKKMIEHMY